MPVLTLQESTYAGPIPEDTILAAEVTAVTEKDPFENDRGEKIVRMEFAFVITEPDSPWEGQRIWGTTPMTFNTSPDCKLRAWITQILGADLPVGMNIDTETLVGMPARIITGQREYTKPNGYDSIRNFVKDIMHAAGAPALAHTVAADEPF